jgi:hypothetical protein
MTDGTQYAQFVRFSRRKNRPSGMCRKHELKHLRPYRSSNRRCGPLPDFHWSASGNSISRPAGTSLSSSVLSGWQDWFVLGGGIKVNCYRASGAITLYAVGAFECNQLLPPGGMSLGSKRRDRGGHNPVPRRLSSCLSRLPMTATAMTGAVRP